MSEAIRKERPGLALVSDPPLDVRAELSRFLAVPVWSDNPKVLCAGRVMGWSKSATYRAVDSGFLPVIRSSATRVVVSTSVLLRLVDGDAA